MVSIDRPAHANATTNRRDHKRTRNDPPPPKPPRIHPRANPHFPPRPTMTPTYQSPCQRVLLYHGDAMDVLPTLAANPE